MCSEPPEMGATKMISQIMITPDAAALLLIALIAVFLGFIAWYAWLIERENEREY